MLDFGLNLSGEMIAKLFSFETMACPRACLLSLAFFSFCLLLVLLVGSLVSESGESSSLQFAIFATRFLFVALVFLLFTVASIPLVQLSGEPHYCGQLFWLAPRIWVISTWRTDFEHDIDWVFFILLLLATKD